MCPPAGGPTPELIQALAVRWGELSPYSLAGVGSAATYLRGDALVYIVPPLGPGPPWEYLVEEATLDSLLQADDTFVALIGADAGDLWAVPADEAAFLIEGRVPQVDAEGRRAWHFCLASQGARWLLRAESNPSDSVDATHFYNVRPST